MSIIETYYRLRIKILPRREVRRDSGLLNQILSLLKRYGNPKLIEFKIIQMDLTLNSVYLERLIRFIEINNEFIEDLTGTISKDLVSFHSPEYEFNDIWELKYYYKILDLFTLVKYRVDKTYLGLISKAKSNIEVYKQGNNYIPVDYVKDNYYFYKGYPLKLENPKKVGYLHNEIEINDNYYRSFVVKDELLGDGFLMGIYTVKDNLFTYLFNIDLDYDSYNYRLINTLLPDTPITYLTTYEKPMKHSVLGRVFIIEFETIKGRKFILIFPITYKKYDAYIKEKLNLTSTGLLIEKKGD